MCSSTLENLTYFDSCLESDWRFVTIHRSKARLAKSGNCFTRSLSGVSRTYNNIGSLSVNLDWEINMLPTWVMGEINWDFIASSQSSDSIMALATSLWNRYRNSTIWMEYVPWINHFFPCRIASVSALWPSLFFCVRDAPCSINRAAVFSCP